MKRRTQIAAALLTLLLAGIVLKATPAQAQVVPLDAERIRAALRVPPQEDDGFIDAAVLAVNQGRLPRSVLESAFLWARKKDNNQFQYFRRALILFARERGVNL